MRKSYSSNVSGNHEDTNCLPDDRQYRQIAAQVFGKGVQVDSSASSNSSDYRPEENAGQRARNRRKQELTQQITTYTWKPKVTKKRKIKPVIFGRCFICYSIISEGDLTNAEKKQKFAALMGLINFQGDSSPAVGEAISKLSLSPYNCLCHICNSICEEISLKQQVVLKLQQEILELQNKSLHTIKLSSAVSTKEIPFSNQSKESIPSIESHLECVRMARKCLLDEGRRGNAAMSPERTDDNEVKSESESDESLIDWESSDPAKEEDSVVDDSHSNPLAAELPIGICDPLSQNDSETPEGGPGCGLEPLPPSTDNIYDDKSPPSPVRSNNSGSLFKPEGSMTSDEYQRASDDDDNVENDKLLSGNEEKEDDKEDTIKIKEVKERGEGEYSTASNNSKEDPQSTGSLAARPVKKNRWYDKQKCDICGVLLANKQNLQLHKQFVHEKPTARPHVCVHCGKTFQSKAYLSSHMRGTHKAKRYYVCLSDCKEGFTDVFTFKRHLSEKHSELSNLKIYHCALCPKSFVDTLSLQRHWKTHKPKKDKDGPSPEYKCEHCGKIFKWKQHWVAHTKAHTGAFSCHICSETFPNREPLQTHLLRKHNETNAAKVFECGVCKKKFVNKRTCQQHEKRHVPNSYEFKCEHCGKGFHEKSHMKVHERTHTGMRPHACNLCPEAFFSVTKLKEHQLDKHSDSVSVELHHCSACGKSFIEKNKLQAHVKLLHGPGDHVCGKCGCTFDKEIRLRIHIKNKCGTVKKGKVWREDNGKLYYRGMEVQRDSENNLKCPFASCQKSFTNQKNLSAHYKIIHIPSDTDKKDLQCDQCGKKFPLPSALSAHIKGVHEGGFSCDICGITRTSQHSINCHKSEVHQGIRPHVCEHCGKAYADKARLQVHLRHHTGERPYCCSVCNKSFIKRCNLTIHQRTLHPEMNDPSNNKVA